jgi:Ca-activated chloride channel homolog
LSIDSPAVNLSEDFVATYDLDAAGADTLNVLTYRNPVSAQPAPTETAPVRSTNEPGFFEAEALLGHGKSSAPGASGSAVSGPPKTLVILFDTSLSMQWEKLERSYQALESLLRTLRPSDRFNLLLFNNQVQTFQPAPVAAGPAAVQHALDFVHSSKLRGGTDLQKALQTGLQQCSASAVASPYLILLSDGGTTREPIQNGKLVTWYADSWKSLPETQRPRTYVFGVGDDANLPLLSVLARQDGLLEH